MAKYEPLKKISKQAVYDALPKDCPEAKELFAKFDDVLRAGFYANLAENYFDEVMDFCRKNPAAMKFATDKGFIREKQPEFEPFDLTLRIERPEELGMLWARLFLDDTTFVEHFTANKDAPQILGYDHESFPMWDLIDDIADSKGLR